MPKLTNPLLIVAGSAATVALLALSFAPAEISFLAWFALVPVLVVLGRHPGRLGLVVLWLAGMAFGAVGFFWLRHVTWLGTVLLAFYLSVYFFLFCVSVRWMSFRRGIPLALAAPLAWTALEYLRGTLMTGFPWLFLAHSQYRALPVIQIADLTGAAGVTFWIAAVNGAVADVACWLLRSQPAVKRSRVAAAGAVVALITVAALAYGWHRLNTLVVREGPRIALVQGNIPQDVKNRLSDDDISDMFFAHVRLTEKAQASSPPPDLVIWPETMAPPYALDDWNNRPDNEWLDVLARLQRRSDLVVGASACPDINERKVYNSVFFLPRGGRGGTRRFDKIHLVPFGEYVPLKWLIGWIVGPMVPYREGLHAGSRHVLFETRGWRFAPTICFEDGFPELVADFARGEDKMDFIVNVTNEGWFRDGTELDQHLAIAVFRAVECRAGFIRAANTGISAFISPTGRIVSKLTVSSKGAGRRDREVAGVLHGVAMTADGRSPYLAVGELFGTVCAAGWFFCMILPVVAGIRRRLRRRAEGR